MQEGYEAWEKHGKRNLLVDEHPMDSVVEKSVTICGYPCAFMDGTPLFCNMPSGHDGGHTHIPTRSIAFSSYREESE
jgi:hypothetical protein